MLIPKSVLSIASLCSNLGPNHLLGGVHFRRDSAGKASAQATDGRAAIEVTWAEPAWDEFPDVGSKLEPRARWSAVIPAKQVLEAQKGLVSRPVRAILGALALVEDEWKKADDGPLRRVEMVSTDLDTIRRLQPLAIEGEFPDFRPCVPSYTAENSSTVKLSIPQLRDLLNVLEKLGTEKNQHGEVVVKVTAPRINGPATFEVRSDDGVRAFGAIMPIVLEEKSGRRYTPAGSEEDDEPNPDAEAGK